MRPIDADRALEIVRDQAIAHPNAYHLTNYATLILREAPTLTDLSKCLAFNSTADDKPQTNADRIRAMNDEEFADALQKFCIAMADCSDCPLYDFGCPKNSIFNYWIEWLQQPVEIKKL